MEIVYAEDVVANLIVVWDPPLKVTGSRSLVAVDGLPARSTQVRMVEFSLSEGHEFECSCGG